MKRTAIKRRPLADTVLASLEPEEKEYRESYGRDRLYFVVNPSGRKRWEMRYKKPETGRWGWMGLGTYPEVTAKLARQRADEAFALVQQGIDPVKQRKARQQAEDASNDKLFSVSAEEWYQRKQQMGRADKTLRGIRYWLDGDALPALGNLPLDRISRTKCRELQEQIEARGAFNTAEKARTWLNQIFGYAIAHGRTENNPASNLADVAAAPPEEKPYPHLLEDQLPDFLRALSTSTCKPIVLTASWMVVRTASRPGMVRFAEWREIDLDKGLWEIPAARMKARRDHVAPLSRQVVASLRALQRLTGEHRYLFPSEGPKSPVISDSTINKCFANIGYRGRMTGHGARHTAKTLLSEHGWPTIWTEMQLAHKPAGMEGIYNQAGYLAQRQVMMQWYCDYLDALTAGMTQGRRAAFDAKVVHR
ncbi:tyrosine-type recombinase/integrase [Halomonas tibetensis]|uniref:Tyrosine-type recombinase/integrase n=1 Tax=Halomonas tibetensis TaxID=2259590 RepID=A0ABV7B7V5_9GAMM